MAIRKIKDENNILTLELDNGDREALNRILGGFNFKNEESALRFAMVVLLNAKNKTVYVDEGDKKVALTPNDELLISDK